MASCTLQLIFFLHFIFIIFANYVQAGTSNVVCDNRALAELGNDPSKLHFCDKTLSYQVRAKDLVERLTLVEKIAQLKDKAEGVKRLHIPAYNWHSEALHGISDIGSGTHFDNTIRSATSFPTVLLTAASFNETYRCIRKHLAISDEARAMHNAGLSGLTFWSPNVNVAIDPRWGRIQETAGEDPFLVSRYGVNYVRGLQDVKGYTNVPDKNSRPLKVAACCKYYTAYGLEKWVSDGTNANLTGTSTDKYHFDAQVSERDMLETFNYPFEMCVKEGDVAGVMCSYNRVNGIPTCADPKLLNGTVRGLWGLNGYIVNDCDWVLAAVLSSQKNPNDTASDAISQAVKAGVDLDCRGDYSPHYIMDAITKQKLTEADIDHALINLYVVLMRLGWFDGSPGNYLNLGKNDVCSEQHLQLAAEAARQGIVLLFNDNVLPLPLTYDGGRKPTVAVVGPHANATTAMLGTYALKTVCRYITPLDAIKGYANVKYAPGCLDANCESISGFQAAVDATHDTDATFVFVGLDLSFENENSDRPNLYLPTNQMALLDTLFSEPSTRLTIIVVLSAGGIDLSEWNDEVHAILWAGYPGAEGGQAIADILFGKQNPAGRLPISWYKGDYTKNLPMTSMQLRPNPTLGYPGRTYKFCTDDNIIFPFGHGMSYTTFSHTISAPHLAEIEQPEIQKCRHMTSNPNKDIPCASIPVANSKCNEMVKIVVTVTNKGQRNGAYVVQLFSSPPDYIKGKLNGILPEKRLVGFQRVFIKSGESVPVEFNLNVCKSFSIISEDGVELLPAGVHQIIAGDDFTSSLVGSDPPAVSTAMSIVFLHVNNQAKRIDL